MMLLDLLTCLLPLALFLNTLCLLVQFKSLKPGAALFCVHATWSYRQAFVAHNRLEQLLACSH